MASIFDVSLSSDSEDADFVPNKNVDVLSDDSYSSESDDETGDKKHQQKKSKKGKETDKKIPEIPAAVETISKIDEKQRIDDIWSSFKKDVGQTVVKDEKKVTSTAVDLAERKSEIKCASKEKTGTNNNQQKNEPKIFEFAGETFTAQTSICEHACDNKKEVANAGSAPVKRGLGSLLDSISKKKKITTLEKTQLDWKTFTSEEGLDEDLKHHRKGKDGFIERQRFLERSDLRSFEIEKSLRESRRKKP